MKYCMYRPGSAPWLVERTQSVLGNIIVGLAGLTMTDEAGKVGKSQNRGGPLSMLKFSRFFEGGG